jgi:hypothetical protein
MLIQVILVTTAVILLAVFIRSPHTQRTLAVKRIAFILFMIASCYMVLRPADTSWLAHKLGVGRGTDLVLYLLVVAFGFFAANTYLRFRTLEKRFTELVRAVALGAVQTPAEAVAGANPAVVIAAAPAASVAPVIVSGAPVTVPAVRPAALTVPEQQAHGEERTVVDVVPGHVRGTA